MQSRRRVVITGIGAITPIGTTVNGLWSGLRAERSAIRTLTRFDPSPYRSHNAGEVPDFVPSDHLERKRVNKIPAVIKLCSNVVIAQNFDQ